MMKWPKKEFNFGIFGDEENRVKGILMLTPFIVLVLCLLWPAQGSADQQHGFVKITCINELDFLEISASRVFNVPDSKRLRDFRPRHKLAEKHGFFSYNQSVIYRCNLPKRRIVITVTPIQPTATGMCGGEARANIEVVQNNIPILEGLFGSECFSSLTKASAFPTSSDGSAIWRSCYTEPGESVAYPNYEKKLTCTDMGTFVTQ